jgi:hypothetical protein
LKVYGTADPVIDVNGSGFLEADGIVITGSRAAGGMRRLRHVGHRLRAGLGNYDISATGGTFTITPATVTVAASASKSYGAATCPWVVTGLVGADTLSSATGDHGQSTRCRRVSVTVWVANPNYDVRAIDSDLTITARPSRLTNTGMVTAS